MATILRGRHKGKRCRIHQYCNDWFNVKVPGERFTIILSPTSLKLSRGEIRQYFVDVLEKRVGRMARLFFLREDGRFVRMSLEPAAHEKGRPR